MKNKIDDIGEKIKRERQRAGLTQSQLAKDHISRNMLSMIEKGDAKPSIDTLTHISNTLDIPAGLFFSSDDKTDALYNKINVITKAKKLFAEGMFYECAQICRSVPFDDEISYLLAEAELALAENDMKHFMLKSASDHLSASSSAARSSIYAKNDFFGTVSCYKAFISFAASKIDIDTLSRVSKLPSRVPSSYITFLFILYYIENGDPQTADKITSSVPSLEPDQMRYLKAKRLSREFKTSAALEILIPLYNSENLSFIEKYSVLADIETCYENRRDFESAYKYSAIKHHMLECFSK